MSFLLLSCLDYTSENRAMTERANSWLPRADNAGIALQAGFPARISGFVGIAKSAMWCLKTGEHAGAPATTTRLHEDETQGPAHRRLLCAQCRALITSDEERMEVAGQHEHICANPHGYAFHIGCFARAPGCTGVGRAESYWSWFPGYSWQLVLCAACHAHLGWLFAAANARFYGLILNRLLAADTDGPAS